MTSKKKHSQLRSESPSLFLDLFYPFHYKVGFTIEQALRGSLLTQQQTIILWTIHSEGENGRSMRRKDIEQRITGWFDVTSSAISKALRNMAKQEEPYLELSEDPRSGREKRVYLTDAGQSHIKEMIDRTETLISRIVTDLDDDEIEAGLLFMRKVSDIVDSIDPKES